jgi:hypothetical protein
VAALRRHELAFSLWWRKGAAAAAFRRLEQRLRAMRE